MVNTGVHVGTDGIALGASSVFKVTNAGVLTASSATITGAITATSGTFTGITVKYRNNRWLDGNFNKNSKCSH